MTDLNSRARSILDAPFLWPTIFLSWLRSEMPFLPQAQLQEAKPLAIVPPSSRHLAAHGRMLREEIFTWVLTTSICSLGAFWEDSGDLLEDLKVGRRKERRYSRKRI